MQSQPMTTETPQPADKPKTPAEDLEVEIFSTDLEVEEIRCKLEKQQERAMKKIELLMRRRRALVRALATERERGAGWTPMHNGRPYDTVTGEFVCQHRTIAVGVSSPSEKRLCDDCGAELTEEQVRRLQEARP